MSDTLYIVVRHSDCNELHQLAVFIQDPQGGISCIRLLTGYFGNPFE
jgi:hypothetical protein